MTATGSSSAAGASAAASVEVLSCPNCLTAGAWSGNRCVYCGTRFTCQHCRTRFTASEIQHAQFCPTCGTFRELPRRQAPPHLQGATTHAPRRSLLDTIRDVLTAAEPVHGTSLRETRLMLARALLEAKRPREAAGQLESALREEGPVPSARLLLERAAALLEAGDEVAGTRAVLKAVERGPEDYRHLLLQAADSLKPSVAASLDRWIVGTSLPGITHALGEADCSVHLLTAANDVGNGRYDEALDHLSAAAALDRAATMRYLEALASPTASAAFPGGEAALATFRARAFARIGDEEQAVAIAGTVIDNALTGEGHPEAEAYEIRARTKDRGRAQRAVDLLEAGRLVGSRGGAAALRRSVALLREAADLDPTNAEIYWYWADNLRLSAYESTPPAADVLHEALDVWERGRRLGPVDQSWPCVVEAALVEALGDAEPKLRRRWAMRGLRAVLDALHRDQQASFNWSWLSRCCRRLELWATASFAMQQCETAAGDFTSHHDAELEERISLRNQTDPGGLIPAVDELERLVGPSPWSRQIRAVALLRDHDYATAIDTVGQAVEGDFSASVRLIQAYVYAMANDPRLVDVVADLEASVGAADVDDLGPLDPAWLALWRGDFDGAERLGAEATDRQAGVVEVDPFESASFRLQLALLTGQGDPTPLLDEALRGITAGSLQELDIELTWVGRVLDHHGRADLSILTDMCRARVAALQEELPTWAEGSAEDALTELDEHLVAGATEEPDLAVVTAARALVSRRIGIPVTTESDWPTVLRVDLGAALIPLDADTRWEEWSLFTDLIPRCRDALRQRLGFPAMGIAIGASYLRPNEFEVYINGVSDGVHEVPIDLCGEEPRPLDSYAGSAPWEPPMAQLTAAVLRHPAAVFVPRTIESLLEEWRDRGPATSAALAQLESDLRLRIAVWQRLHDIVSREGRLPEWDEGLGEVLASLGVTGGADG